MDLAFVTALSLYSLLYQFVEMKQLKQVSFSF